MMMLCTDDDGCIQNVQEVDIKDEMFASDVDPSINMHTSYSTTQMLPCDEQVLDDSSQSTTSVDSLHVCDCDPFTCKVCQCCLTDSLHTR